MLCYDILSTKLNIQQTTTRLFSPIKNLISRLSQRVCTLPTSYPWPTILVAAALAAIGGYAYFFGERAAAIDPNFDHAGPHRLLGALYLRAPGPPAGIGSLRRAVEHLEKTAELAPDYPENLIFLAETYLKSRRCEEAGELILRAQKSLSATGNLMDQEKWQKQIDELQARLSSQP
jgi:tetratricopeptide (TPR) repeat protein